MAKKGFWDTVGSDIGKGVKDVERLGKFGYNVGKAFVRNATGGDLKGMAKQNLASPRSFKKGGVVKKTGMAKVHKGEKVLTKAQTEKMKRGKLSKAADKAFSRTFST